MANTKISELTAATTPLAGTELAVVVQGGTTKQVAVSDFTAIADGSITLAKMANLAQDQAIMRVTASTGVPETATITAAARTVLDDTTVGAMLATLGGQVKLTRVTESLTSANLTATVNAHHVLTISSLDAERSFVIPAGTAEGDLISWECITAAPTTAGREMVLIGESGSPGVTLVLGGIDRVATADDYFRYFNAGEYGVLRWDATNSKWRLIGDGRIPSRVTASIVGQSLASATDIKLDISAATVTAYGFLADATNDVFTTRRAMHFNASMDMLSAENHSGTCQGICKIYGGNYIRNFNAGGVPLTAHTSLSNSAAAKNVGIWGVAHWTSGLSSPRNFSLYFSCTENITS